MVGLGKKIKMINNIQNKAKQSFIELGYPDRKSEDWKYTNTDKFSHCIPYNRDIPFKDSDSFLIDDSINIIIYNGSVLNNHNYKIDGLTITHLDESVSKESLKNFSKIGKNNKNGVVAHNTAEFKDALHISIDKNFDFNIPINIIEFSSGLRDNEIIFPRIYVHLENSSSAKIFIRKLGDNSYGFTNFLSEFYCEDSSSIEIIYINEVKNQKSIDSLYFAQEDNSQIKFLSTLFGNDLYRSNINVDINGNNCLNDFGVLILGDRKSHTDFHVNMNHNKSNSVSNFLCRSMLRDRAKGYFNGKIFVKEYASLTDASLNNNNLLLSNDSSMQSNPQLEINNEDVKCAHGSTTGNLDQDSLFYLLSRSISKSQAEQILIKAFANKLLDMHNCKLLSIDQKVQNWIEQK
tara:strand:- start:24498 stop:25712 length:1215 start_codon:yes stop_codon:yes gene_type:complete